MSKLMALLLFQSQNILDLFDSDTSSVPVSQPVAPSKQKQDNILDLLGDIDLSMPSNTGKTFSCPPHYVANIGCVYIRFIRKKHR